MTFISIFFTLQKIFISHSSNLSETSRYSSNFFETIFDNGVQEEHYKMSEVDKYLDLCLTPSAHPAGFGGKQGKMNF